jgi:hypothetical protein
MAFGSTDTRSAAPLCASRIRTLTASLGMFLAACGTATPSLQAPVTASAGQSAAQPSMSPAGAGVSGVVANSGTAAAQGSSGAAGSLTGAAGAAAGSGGRSGTAGAGGASGAGGMTVVAGAGSQAGAGGAPSVGSNQVFSQCRFHFGTTDGIAKNNPAMIEQLDFFTPGWMGLKDTFDMQYVCDYTKPGGTFAKQVPAVVAYVAAFYAKRIANLKDCNASGAQQDLCVAGAKVIQDNLAKIVAVYESYAQGFADCYGTTRPIIFMMEPDFYQYTISNQAQPWTGAQAGKIMSQFVSAIKKHLPNAVFSMDISPWVAPNDGEDNGKQWYANFDMTQFTFINTSGGGTNAATAKIRGDKMTWRGVSQVTGKPILADTGYGVNGSSAGPDAAWDTPANIAARMDDGVVSVSQYNPAAGWGSTIAAMRSQLKMPAHCP